MLDLNKAVDYRFYLDEYEVENLDLYLDGISSGSVIIDVGANIGIYSLLAARKAGPEGKVIAFEPADVAFERFTKNIGINGFQNITAIKMGVSDKSRVMTFRVCDDDAYNSLGSTPMKKVSREVNINTVSIDEYLREHPVSKINVIKIDTEGAEYLVLKGAVNTLKKYNPVLFFEYNPYTAPGFSFNKLESVDLLRGLGYKLYEFVDGKMRSIKEYDIKTCDIIGVPSNV